MIFLSSNNQNCSVSLNRQYSIHVHLMSIILLRFSIKLAKWPLQTNLITTFYWVFPQVNAFPHIRIAPAEQTSKCQAKKKQMLKDTYSTRQTRRNFHIFRCLYKNIHDFIKHLPTPSDALLARTHYNTMYLCVLSVYYMSYNIRTLSAGAAKNVSSPLTNKIT